MPIPDAVINFVSNTEKEKQLEVQAEIRAEIMANEKEAIVIDDDGGAFTDEDFISSLQFDDSFANRQIEMIIHTETGFFKYY